MSFMRVSDLLILNFKFEPTITLKCRNDASYVRNKASLVEHSTKSIKILFQPKSDLIDEVIDDLAVPTRSIADKRIIRLLKSRRCQSC